MRQAEPKPQWTLDVTIYHDQSFKHLIRARVLGLRSGWHTVGEWRWTGHGVPGPLVEDLTCRVLTAIEEHLISRYGVKDEIPPF